jgi:hypothetical protein
MVNNSININNTITSHLNSLDVGNPCPGLGQAKEYGGDKLVKGIHPFLTLLHAYNRKTLPLFTQFEKCRYHQSKTGFKCV